MLANSRSGTLGSDSQASALSLSCQRIAGYTRFKEQVVARKKAQESGLIFHAWPHVGRRRCFLRTTQNCIVTHFFNEYATKCMAPNATLENC